MNIKEGVNRSHSNLYNKWGKWRWETTKNKRRKEPKKIGINMEEKW